MCSKHSYQDPPRCPHLPCAHGQYVTLQHKTPCVDQSNKQAWDKRRRRHTPSNAHRHFTKHPSKCQQQKPKRIPAGTPFTASRHNRDLRCRHDFAHVFASNQPQTDTGAITHTAPLFDFPSPLGAAANWLPWVQHVVWIPHDGLPHVHGLPHVLQDGLAQRHHLNRLRRHALQRGWGHVPVLGPLQSAARLWRRGWWSARTACSLPSVPHAHVSLMMCSRFPRTHTASGMQLLAKQRAFRQGLTQTALKTPVRR